MASGVTCVSNKYLFDGENLTHTDRFTGGLTIQHNATESLTNRLAVGWDYNNLQNQWIRPATPPSPRPTQVPSSKKWWGGRTFFS